MGAISVNLLLLLASCCVWHNCCAVPYPEYNLRIYGGHPVNITEVPYMARIQTVRHKERDSLICGAVIVHEKFVLTSAGCASFIHDSEKVIVGTDKFDPHTGEIYDIEKVFMHPKYNDNTDDYDMGVVKLKKKLKISDRVQLIKMAKHSAIPQTGDLMKTMGFGETEKHKLPKVLLALQVPFVDRDTCGKDYKKERVVTERMICAGGEQGKGDAWGDGGSPLVYKDRVVGLASWAHWPLAQKSFPGVFSNVASMRDFIDDVIKNNS